MTRLRTALGVLVAGALSWASPASAASPFAIAFDSDRSGTSDIYVMNANGSGQTRLTLDPADDAAPAWSPDGEQIAFASNRDRNWEIYTMTSDGRTQTRLTEGPAGDYDPTWSPDGTRIAFESLRDGSWDVWVMNADGSDEQRVSSSSANDFDPAWLDDTRLAYASQGPGGYQVFVAPAPPAEPGQGAATLTRSLAGGGLDPEGLTGFDPTLASDGSAAVSRLEGTNYDIVLRDAATGTERNLTATSRAEFSPVFAEDGRVLFVAEDGGDYEIYAVGTDGSGLVNLTDNAQGLDLNPDWNPTVTGGFVPRTPSVERVRGPAICPPAENGVRRVGSAGPDRLVGTKRRDVLCGLDGDDELIGKQKGDHLDGGLGADRVQGGQGKDRLLGKEGFPDLLNGAAGSDRATADEDGRDSLAGVEAVD